jgi:hypothetical protein
LPKEAPGFILDSSPAAYCLFNSSEEMEIAMTDDREHNEQANPPEAKARTAANQGNEKDGAPPA